MTNRQLKNHPYMKFGNIDLKNDTIGNIIDKIKSRHIIHLKIYSKGKYFKFFKRKLYDGTVDELKKDEENRVRLNYIDNYRINKTDIVIITKSKKGTK